VHAFDAGSLGWPAADQPEQRRRARPEQPSATRVHGNHGFLGSITGPYRPKLPPPSTSPTRPGSNRYCARQPVPFVAGRHRAGAREHIDLKSSATAAGADNYLLRARAGDSPPVATSVFAPRPASPAPRPPPASRRMSRRRTQIGNAPPASIHADRRSRTGAQHHSQSSSFTTGTSALIQR